MACKDAKRWQGVDALGVMGDSDMSCVLRVLMPGIFSREAVAAACCAASCSCASSAAAAAWPSGCSMAMACMYEQCDSKMAQLLLQQDFNAAQLQHACHTMPFTVQGLRDRSCDENAQLYSCHSAQQRQW